MRWPVLASDYPLPDVTADRHRRELRERSERGVGGSMADRGSRSRSRAAGMLLRPQPGHGRVGPDGVMYSERSSSRAHRLHALGGRELSHLGTIHERIVGALHGSRSGPTCGTKVDDCIRATAPAYLLLELLSLVCGLGRQEQLGRSRVHHVHAGGKQCFEGQRRWGHSIEASSSSTHSCFARLSACSQSWRCS